MFLSFLLGYTYFKYLFYEYLKIIQEIGIITSLLFETKFSDSFFSEEEKNEYQTY